MQAPGLSVLVIGGGIGGLACALALRRRGARVRVLEQAEEITEVGAGLQISPNGLAVLRALGLEAALMPVAMRAEAVVLRDYRRPAPVLRLDLARHAPDQHYLFVHRADLVDRLARANRDAGVRIRLGSRVTQIAPGRPPVARLSGGEEISADLIIAADGIRSAGRAALNGADSPRFTRQVAWRALIPGKADQPREAQVFMGPGRHLVVYPLRGGSLTNIVAVREQPEWAAEGWDHAEDPAILRAAFDDFGAEPRSLLAAVRHVRRWGLFRHPVAPHWVGPGVALVGDAAHPTLPFLAQGANLALEDAWVLARTLQDHPDLDPALRRYQAERQPRARRVIDAATGNAWKYHLRMPPVRGAAHLALRLAGAIAPGRMVRQFDWLYRHDVTAR
jgi:salicylate hydroxylase